VPRNPWLFFYRFLLGWHNEKFGSAGESFSKKVHIRVTLIPAHGSFKMAAADADEGHSWLPKQDTGGSDALCLGAPPGLREAIVSAAKRRLSKQKPVEEHLF